MLEIRGEQLVAFMQSFVDWTVQYLRGAEARRVQTWSDAELRARVEHASARGLRHGLRDTQALLRFVSLALELGPRFDQHPEIHAALSDRSRGPERRLDTILARPELMAQLAEAAGPDPWSSWTPPSPSPDDRESDRSDALSPRHR